jgi:hypothetical protein
MQRSEFALILQTLERQTVRYAIDFVTEKGFTVGSIIHDGFFIEKKTGVNEKPDILTDINAYVKEKTGTDVTFEWGKIVNFSIAIAEEASCSVCWDDFSSEVVRHIIQPCRHEVCRNCLGRLVPSAVSRLPVRREDDEDESEPEEADEDKEICIRCPTCRFKVINI